ncbi:MAG: hypothetical protein WCF19_07860 [Chlamydiales bacterium]
MIELSVKKIHSSDPIGGVRPEDFGFQKMGEKYQTTYHLVAQGANYLGAQGAKSENVDVSFSFSADRTDEEAPQACIRLFDAIKKMFKARLETPLTWSCVLCTLKNEFREAKRLVDAQQIEITTKNELLKSGLERNGVFEWLRCEAESAEGHQSAWTQFFKPNQVDYT